MNATLSSSGSFYVSVCILLCHVCTYVYLCVFIYARTLCVNIVKAVLMHKYMPTYSRPPTHCSAQGEPFHSDVRIQ